MALSTIVGVAHSVVLTIANCAGSYVVEDLVSTAYSYLRDCMLPANIEVELNRLKLALPKIRAVMGIAEALKMKDPNTSEWVEQFTQAVEASEDVLDELEYKKLEDMVKIQDETSGSASSSKKRKQCTINDGTLVRLKEAVTMLDQAAASVENLLELANVLGIRGLSESQQEASEVLRRETTSFIAEREVFGRDVEKNKIIGWLKRPTDTHLSSFGIVGVGGVGKTTLVQFAYQEMRGSNHFDKTIWVCVSTIFSVKDITRKILGELGESSCSDKPLNALQGILMEKILSKKILLILDDVWDDKRRREWEQLVDPLRFVQQGSKILFTTRMNSVADLLVSVISSEHESLALQGLRDQELRFLFNSYAFHGFNLDNHCDLQAIGDDILKMLRGSPLVAKVIGSLLNSHMDHQYWRTILNHGSILKLEQAKDVVEVLKLSYYHLPADLQVCFRFCSIFPQDHLFDKNDLIKMWIASGFIQQQSSQEERLEDIGEDYFNLLLRKSFFEYSNDPWKGERYVMHDLLHELAQNVSDGECCRIAPNDKCITIPKTVRHVSVHESQIEKVSDLENLRSLVITTCMDKAATDQNIFVLPKSLIKKSVRLLKIEGYRICELPEEISCLVHLRYLSIEVYDVTQSFKYLLHASVYKLYHLQVLKISIPGNNSSYSGIETTGMTNLLRLRYMSLPEEIMQTIPRVYKLTSLQELTFFIGREIGYSINELGTLNNLRHLSIKKIENTGNPVEAKSANLLKKNNLISLSLEWTLWSNPNNSEQIIDHLQPHPNLMEFTVENYIGQRSPSWMEESPPLNLSSLKLFNCPIWKNQLSSWQMPYLKVLEICNCPKLDKLPDMPLSLNEFRIDKVGLISLPDLYPCSDNNTPAPLSLKSSLRVVEIISCPNLISLNGFLEQGNLDLQDTKELIIKDCQRLVHLPTHGFGNLTSLIELILTDCPKLAAMDFWGYHQPTKLQQLIMGNCGAIDVPLLEALSGLTTITMMKIMNCRKLTKLPSLPLSLTTFLIDSVPVSDLPQYYHSSNSSGGPLTSSLKSSLRELAIINCPKLTSLNGFLQQGNIVFQSIEDITVSNCRNLLRLPVGGFGKFLSLKKLTIKDCPMLAAVDNQSNLLPVKLKFLDMKNCGGLDVPLLGSASSLDTLTDLWINNCANIFCIPSSEYAFGSLNELHILRCKKLVEHSFREQVHGVSPGTNSTCLKLSYLEIDHLSLLLIEPLRSLRSVMYLTVWCCSEMEALPEQWFMQNSSTLRRLSIHDASTLKSLPTTMERLTALEYLLISKADVLEELPRLPTLKEKCIKGRGSGLRAPNVGMSNQPDLSMSSGIGSGPHMFPDSNRRRHSRDEIGGFDLSLSLSLLKVTSSAEPEARKRHEVGESSHLNDTAMEDNIN